MWWYSGKNTVVNVGKYVTHAGRFRAPRTLGAKRKLDGFGRSECKRVKYPRSVYQERKVNSVSLLLVFNAQPTGTVVSGRRVNSDNNNGNDGVNSDNSNGNDDDKNPIVIIMKIIIRRS